ncbi:hypothetical protein CL6EHI_110160 [Entamoeba histolytica]|uniref:Uncharacterized protein n=4 Tax=Entamoeba histolytica TaxID=5759 RepID=C4LU70_ENTH1|nr:hypothetical protein EHI_110160 [Entamoeba histolytica HM-1:IMSS]EAL51643.1 hypothetical protein EHI_110160 [Entamoeba histolytica HM-1:IMSS]ENY62697.1 hypothetical protein EHI7A_004150 [Entamoeba histolytica HM-1:IMSS-A]GAT92142.1 hypothetical protein CL6EHI_110160 [Entamoeba histolytica]|eukprot:XP_657026.1 hypothetical protein EHI_110160 [Entamoeba histolytica HM-1:IMSS]
MKKNLVTVMSQPNTMADVFKGLNFTNPFSNQTTQTSSIKPNEPTQIQNTFHFNSSTPFNFSNQSTPSKQEEKKQEEIKLTLNATENTKQNSFTFNIQPPKTEQQNPFTFNTQPPKTEQQTQNEIKLTSNPFGTTQSTPLQTDNKKPNDLKQTSNGFNFNLTGLFGSSTPSTLLQKQDTTPLTNSSSGSLQPSSSSTNSKDNKPMGLTLSLNLSPNELPSSLNFTSTSKQSLSSTFTQSNNKHDTINPGLTKTEEETDAEEEEEEYDEDDEESYEEDNSDDSGSCITIPSDLISNTNVSSNEHNEFNFTTEEEDIDLLLKKCQSEGGLQSFMSDYEQTMKNQIQEIKETCETINKEIKENYKTELAVKNVIAQTSRTINIVNNYLDDVIEKQQEFESMLKMAEQSLKELDSGVQRKEGNDLYKVISTKIEEVEKQCKMVNETINKKLGEQEDPSLIKIKAMIDTNTKLVEQLEEGLL